MLCSPILVQCRASVALLVRAEPALSLKICNTLKHSWGCLANRRWPEPFVGPVGGPDKLHNYHRSVIQYRISSNKVAVSVSGRRELPSAVRAWFDMWLWLLEDENPALVALFDSSAAPNIGPIYAYLSSIARRARIQFFSAHRQVSLFPVFRPREEGIWPESVERALHSWLFFSGIPA
jgi:hypothetical protein